ncbi:HTH DNA binding protein [Arthrobacter phage Waltz]|nr:HTH DNA binding protein [Arthrobacter phage Waltz]
MPHPSDRRGFTPAQQEVIAVIQAGTQPGTPYAGTAKSIERAIGAGTTLKQVENALRGLEAAACLTKSWNPDRYVWNFTLSGEAAK